MRPAFDPDATGTVPVGTGGTGRLLRFPVRLRIAPAAVEQPMIRPDADEAAAFVERTAATTRFDDAPCADCPLYAWSRDDRAYSCTWGESHRHAIEDCAGFDAHDYDAEAWARIADGVCDVQPAQVA